MAVLRTQRFAIGVVPAAAPMADAPDGTPGTPEQWSTAAYVYTCPPDKRAVVRHVDLWMEFATIPPDVFPEAYLGYVSWCIMTAAQKFVVLCNLQTTTVHTGRDWTGTCVLHPGDQIYVTSSKSDSALHYQVSGAELVIPA